MLEFRSVSVKYGKIVILENISLHIESQKVVSIIGSNGAGKTTILNAVSGLVEPFQGDIFFHHGKLKGIPAHKRPGMGIVQIPEGRELFPKMSVRENLLMGSIRIKKAADLNDSMERILQLFPRLRERLHQSAGSLSGGEQQMLAIGRGLICRPRLLMMDEPSLGLAPIVVMEIFQVITNLNKAGMTLLLVEQNVRQSLMVSDYAYIIENGRIALEGEGKRLLEDKEMKKVYFGLT